MLFPSDINKKFFSQVASSSIPTREEIEQKYKWDVSHIYLTDSAWEEDFKWVENQIPGYAKFQGALANSSDDFLNCLKFNEAVGIKLDRLSLYAMLSKDSDMKNQNSQAMYDRIQSLSAKASSMSSFINPEILEIPEVKLRLMLSSNSELKVYSHYVDNLIRVNIPQMSGERRQELIKVTHEKGEEAKISIRQIRQDKIKSAEEMVKVGKVSEDEEERFKKELQKA